MTAGAPPPSIIFKKMRALGFEVMHVYGLTETYGHVTQCAWNDEWNNFDEEKQNEIKARQGVRYPNTEGVVVLDPETMKEVPFFFRSVSAALLTEELFGWREGVGCAMIILAGLSEIVFASQPKQRTSS